MIMRLSRLSLCKYLIILFPISSSLSWGMEVTELYEVHGFPKVGPVIRDLTSHSVTIMAQGDVPPKQKLFSQNEPPHPNVGLALLAQISSKGKVKKTILKTFSMASQDRHVGHVTFNKLIPDQHYILKTGYVHFLPSLLKETNFDWSSISEISFTTRSKASYPEIFSFLVGSCRRIGLKDPHHWKEEGDQTAKAMLDNIEQWDYSGNCTDSIALIGDQIYADAMGPLFAAKTFDSYAHLYEKAFSLPYYRTLITRTGIPVHMVRDDHEFKNDADAEMEAKNPEQSTAAHKAYALYQRPFGQATPHFWYNTSNGVEMFFTDTRSERYPSHKQIISSIQLQALKDWLIDKKRKDLIKIVITSVPFFLLKSNDSWDGYQAQRYDLLKHILNNNIQHVMFISGDAHCQNDALFHAYNIDGSDTGRSFLEVLVSGLFAVSRDKANLITDTVTVQAPGSKKGYQLKTEADLAPTLLENLFARITGNHKTKQVKIQVYSAENKLLKEVNYQL